MSDQELQRRLSRMGKRKRKSRSSPDTKVEFKTLSQGEEVFTSHGPTLVLDHTYSIDHVHGNAELSTLDTMDFALASEIAGDPNLGKIELKDLLFLDTETTGLVGGAGTIAFLVGVGRFVDDSFRLRQFFLREPSEEPAMLELLEAEWKGGVGFVTYNGKAFDLPLLDMRYNMGLRKRSNLTSSPQFDLLFPARRLWRRSLPNCTLGTIEKQVLGVSRSDKDVPGEQIPGMYLDYLKSGDPSEMERVIYHNEIDILSLVNLTAEIMEKHIESRMEDTDPAEALGIARWHESEGRVETAMAYYHIAISNKDEELQVEALRHFTVHLKRVNQRENAIARWLSWHQLAPDDPRPCIELAMYYEWHEKDLALAKHWAQEALVCLSHQPKGWRRDAQWDEVEHRLRRLERKLAS